jgi:hypothetical protein
MNAWLFLILLRLFSELLLIQPENRPNKLGHSAYSANAVLHHAKKKQAYETNIRSSLQSPPEDDPRDA